MANISNEIRAFQNAVYGEEVRSSMISAIQKINTVTENCESTVNSFSSNISSATTAANNAASNANTAASNANNAATAANTAKDAANTAASNANAAVTSANNAASNATAAATSANNAEAARVTAENARTNAESTRQANESARQSAEQARVSAEATRANSESARDSAESARQTNEITRQGNERQRQNSETLRENAESSRASGFSDMQAAFADMQRTVIPQATESTMGGVIVGDGLSVDNALLSLATTKSGSGTAVTSNGTALESAVVYGQSVQNGTPTPDAPVPVQVVDGKNLLDVTMTSQTMNGLTFVVNPDKTISVTGTASSDTYITVGSVRLPDGTYRLSGCPEGGSRTTYRLYYNRSSAVEFDYGGGVTIIANDEANVQVRIAIYTGTTVDMVFRPQIERGSTNTPYVPYGSIGIVVGDTATPIDLQGNALASLPDGTRDELHVDSAGRVWIEKRVGYVSTNDLSANVAGAAVLTNFVRIVCSGALTDNPAPANSTTLNHNGFCNVAPFTGAGYSSDTLHCYAHLTGFYLFAPVGDKQSWDATTAAEWVTEHGAYAYYTPAATTTIDLGYIIPPAIPEDGAMVSVSASITPVIDVSWWENGAAAVASAISKLMDEIKSLKAQIAALATS